MGSYKYVEPAWILGIKAAYPEVFRELDEFGFACDEGWGDLIQWALAKMVVADPGVRVLQIKEKFGMLCIYADSDNPEVHEFCRDAEAISARICERCGNPGGHQVDQGRIKTLCEICAEQERQAPVV